MEWDGSAADPGGPETTGKRVGTLPAYFVDMVRASDERSVCEMPCQNVLVVDDDEDTLELLRGVLQREGYAVEVARGGLEAMRRAEQRPFDLILTDLTMASGDGFTLVKELRKAGVHEGPVLLMSGEDHVNRRVRGLDSGADDFVPKPIQVHELCARVRAHLRRARRHDEVKRNSLCDALTGLLNRQGLTDRFVNLSALLKRRPGTLSLLLIDIDGFKKVNDEQGHAAGDALLSQVGRTLMSSVRASDSVARWGGDEFVILAPEADAETVAGLCRRVRASFPLQVALDPGNVVSVELSIGVATLSTPNEPLKDLMSRADAAMYADKRARKAGARSRTFLGLAHQQAARR